MVQSNEESVLLLIKEDTKFSTAKRMTRLFTILDSMGLKGYDVNEDSSVIEMLSSGEYKFDYLIISLEYDMLNECILKAKQYFPKIAIIISYDKNTPQAENKLSDLEKTYGIKCFLEKATLNMQNLTAAFKKVKTDMALKRETDQRYTFIQGIAAGSMGIVDLYVDNQAKRLTAVKRISTEGMNKEAKLKVLREIDLMKSIKMPTVIEFYDTTFDNEFRYIYMEYADGGTLEDKVVHCKVKGERLSPDQILEWTIEIALALWVLNKNSIMHRDLKCENILLHTEKEGEKILGVAAKLSDLGISRTKSEGMEDMTICGTPYYVSPEIASDFKQYDYNTDVWSLGVVLYEMITLKKPFGDPSDSIKVGNGLSLGTTLSMGDLYEIIRTQPYAKLKNCHPRLKFLVKVMLIKDPKVRWNMIDIFKLDFVLEKTKEIMKKYNWDSQIPFIDEILNLEKAKISGYSLLNLLKEEDLKLFEYAFNIGELATYTPYKKSFFSGSENFSFLASNLSDAFNDSKEDLGITTESQEFFSNLIKKEILLPLSHPGLSYENQISNFETNAQNTYYLISMDKLKNTNENIINQNNVNIPKNVDLLTLSQYILKHGKKLIKNINKESAIGEVILSKSHLLLLAGIQSFKMFKILSLKEESGERQAFLLNLYQIMLIHFILLSLDEKSVKNGTLLISYTFEDFTLTNMEIKHVIFRKNKKPPGNYLRLVYNTDPKNSILTKCDDNRILLLLLDFEEDVFNILKYFRVRIFRANSIPQQLNKVVLDFLYKNLIVDESEDIILLPPYIEHLVSDFNSSDTPDLPQHLLRMLYEAFQKNISKETPSILKVKKDEEKTRLFEVLFGSNLTAFLRKIQNKNWKVNYVGK